MFKLIDKVKRLETEGREIIHLTIGDPDFITPRPIVEAAKRSLDLGETHYGSSWGVSELIQTMREAAYKSRGFLADVDQVLVAPVANISIFYAIFCLVNPGDVPRSILARPSPAHIGGVLDGLQSRLMPSEV